MGKELDVEKEIMEKQNNKPTDISEHIPHQILHQKN